LGHVTINFIAISNELVIVSIFLLSLEDLEDCLHFTFLSYNEEEAVDVLNSDSSPIVCWIFWCNRRQVLYFLCHLILIIHKFVASDVIQEIHNIVFLSSGFFWHLFFKLLKRSILFPLPHHLNFLLAPHVMFHCHSCHLYSSKDCYPHNCLVHCLIWWLNLQIVIILNMH